MPSDVNPAVIFFSGTTGTVLMIQFSKKMVSRRTVPINDAEPSPLMLMKKNPDCLSSNRDSRCIITMICFTAVITLQQEPLPPLLPQPQLQPQQPQRQPSLRQQQP